MGSIDASKKKYHCALLSKPVLLNTEVKMRRVELELKKKFWHIKMEQQMMNCSLGSSTSAIFYRGKTVLSSLCDSSASLSMKMSDKSDNDGHIHALAKRGTNDSDTIFSTFKAISRFALQYKNLVTLHAAFGVLLFEVM